MFFQGKMFLADTTHKWRRLMLLMLQAMQAAAFGGVLQDILKKQRRKQLPGAPAREECPHPPRAWRRGANQYARYIHCRDCGQRISYDRWGPLHKSKQSEDAKKTGPLQSSPSKKISFPEPVKPTEPVKTEGDSQASSSGSSVGKQISELAQVMMQFMQRQTAQQTELLRAIREQKGSPPRETGGRVTGGCQGSLRLWPQLSQAERR